jgi:hypothetical protein
MSDSKLVDSLLHGLARAFRTYLRAGDGDYGSIAVLKSPRDRPGAESQDLTPSP